MTSETEDGQMWKAVQEYRFAMIELDARYIVTMLNMARNPVRFLNVFTEKIPDDAFVYSVNTDWSTRTIQCLLVSKHFDVLEAGARPPIILTEVKSIDLLKIEARIKRGDGQAADGWNCYAEVRPQVKPGYMRTILLSTKRYVALAVVVGSEIRLRQCDPFAGVDGFDVARDVFDYGNCIEYWQWISDPTGETEDGYTERVETPDSGASPDSDATE